MRHTAWLALLLCSSLGCRSRLGEVWERPDLGSSAPVDAGAPDRAAAADLAAPVDSGAAGWPMPGHDPQHRSRSAATGPQQGALKWTSASAWQGPPVVGSDGTIYVGSGSRVGVTALSPDDGRVLWSAPIGCQNLALGPDGTIYTDPCTNVPRLCAIEPVNRAIKWCAITPSDPLVPLVIAGDGTIYATFSRAVSAIEPRAGKVLWTAALPGQAIGVALALDGRVIAVDSGHAVALDPLTGETKWSANPGRILLSPSIGLDGSIYLVIDLKGGYVTQLIALDPADGLVRWRGFTSNNTLASAPAVATDGSLRIADAVSLIALNPAGILAWSLPLRLRGAIVALDAGDVAFAAAPEPGAIHAVGRDGRLRWSFALGTPLRGPLVIGVSGILIVTGADGKLRAIGP